MLNSLQACEKIHLTAVTGAKGRGLGRGGGGGQFLIFNLFFLFAIILFFSSPEPLGSLTYNIGMRLPYGNIFNISSETTGPIEAKSLEWGNKSFLKWSWSHEQDAAMPTYMLKTLKCIFFETKNPVPDPGLRE